MSRISLAPISKRILIKPEEKKKTGTLLLVNDKPLSFIVLAIGDEVTKVNVNDVIYLDRYSGMEINHEGEKFLVIEENNILAKVID